jgi:hypothetical protein
MTTATGTGAGGGAAGGSEGRGGGGALGTARLGLAGMGALGMAGGVAGTGGLLGTATMGGDSSITVVSGGETGAAAAAKMTDASSLTVCLETGLDSMEFSSSSLGLEVVGG